MVWLDYGSFYSTGQPVAVAVMGVRVKKPDRTGPLNTNSTHGTVQRCMTGSWPSTQIDCLEHTSTIWKSTEWLGHSLVFGLSVTFSVG
jgi:hypothetical protein